MKDLIGILDSGVGGVSVLQKAAELLPNENFIYYGDNANAPYGPKPTEEIKRLSARAVEHVLAHDVKAIVLACNTMTAAYAADLRAVAKIPVIGMEPAVKPASLARNKGYILAMATKATLHLDKFTRLMELYGENVIPVEGKGLVEIVESGMAGTMAAEDALMEIFMPYMNRQIDGIVLGCTHYPFLRKEIERIFPGAGIFDGREGTVRQLRRRLVETGGLTLRTSPGEITFETSGNEGCIRRMKMLFENKI